MCFFSSNNVGVLDWSFCWKFRRRPVLRVHILRWRNSRQNQALSNSQSRALRAGKGRGVRKSRNLWTRWKERPGNRGRTGEDTKWTVNFDIFDVQYFTTLVRFVQCNCNLILNCGKSRLPSLMCNLSTFSLSVSTIISLQD